MPHGTDRFGVGQSNPPKFLLVKRDEEVLALERNLNSIAYNHAILSQGQHTRQLRGLATAELLRLFMACRRVGF